MKIAILQSDSAGQTPQARLALLADAARDADGADLLLCPELFLSGYAAPAGEICRHAEAADGALSQQVSGIARDHGLAIVYGYPERAGDRLYNAALCIGPDGAPLANHRKLMLPPGFEADLFSPGRGLTLFSLGNMRFGLVICYDVEFPEAVRAAAVAGAEVLLVPTALGADWGVVSERVVPARAFENGIYLAYANHAGREGEITYFGGSCLVGPDGRDLARAGASATLIRADVDPARVRAAQARLPYHRDRLLLLERIGKDGD